MHTAMVTPGYLTSTLIMGAILLLIALSVAVFGKRVQRPPLPRRESATGASDQSTPRLPGETVATTLYGSPATYVVGFLLLIVVAGGGPVLFVLGYDVGSALLALVFALFAGYAFFGVYQTARSRRHSTARATAEGMSGVVLLVFAAVFVKLLTTG